MHKVVDLDGIGASYLANRLQLGLTLSRLSATQIIQWSTPVEACVPLSVDQSTWEHLDRGGIVKSGPALGADEARANLATLDGLEEFLIDRILGNLRSNDRAIAILEHQPIRSSDPAFKRFSEKAAWRIGTYDDEVYSIFGTSADRSSLKAGLRAANSWIRLGFFAADITGVSQERGVNRLELGTLQSWASSVFGVFADAYDFEGNLIQMR